MRENLGAADGNTATWLNGDRIMKKIAREFLALCTMLAVTAALVSFQYVPYLS